MKKSFAIPHETIFYNIILYKTCRKSTNQRKNFLLLQLVNN